MIDQPDQKEEKISELEKRVKELEGKETTNTEKPIKTKTIAIVVEFVLGILGIYGIGHLIAKRWTSGILFFIFSFFWLFIEGITKDVLLAGNYPTGLCGLAFHAPVVIVSLFILKKRKK